MIEKEKPNEFIQSFANGLTLICAFDAADSKMTLSEVAAKCGMTRAMARRLLWTLEKLGYVENAGRLFYLKPKILELGYAYLSSQRLITVAQPIMERLAEQIQESCSMSVMDGLDIVYVLRIPTKRIMKISLGVGTRLPAWATSMGRALLGAYSDAELDTYFGQITTVNLTEYTITDKNKLKKIIIDAKKQGWVIVNQELELGLCSAAVPILNSQGKVVAAINIGTPSTSTVMDTITSQYLPALRNAANEIMQVM
jgi:IclR family pca regulon transcriptional regulator